MRYIPPVIVASPAVIFAVCERQTGVTRAMLRSRGRQTRLAAMRAVVGKALFELSGFSLPEVATELRRDYSTVTYQFLHTMKRPALDQQYQMLRSEVEQVTKAACIARNIALTAPEEVAESASATP